MRGANVSINSDMLRTQFEADHGSLEAALSVQQRRREALGERPGDAVRLPLLMYRHMGLWPTATPGQRRHFETVLGERPAPAEAAAQPGANLLLYTQMLTMQSLFGIDAMGTVPCMFLSREELHPKFSTPDDLIALVGVSTCVARCVIETRTLRMPPPAGPADERTPEGAAPKPEPEEPPAATGSNITKFPHELGLFIANLPPPSVPIGPAPDVDAVIDVSCSSTSLMVPTRMQAVTSAVGHCMAECLLD